MPCRSDHSEFPSLPPASFPTNFQRDDVNFHRAIAEHNFKRVEEGLPTRNYLELSADEQRLILRRSNELKLSPPGPRVIFEMSPPPRATDDRLSALLQRERNLFHSIASYVLAAGFVILLVCALRFL